MEYPIGLGGQKWGTPSAHGALKKIDSKKQRNKKEGGLSFPPPCWAEKAASMAPSWAPKSIKNRLKIDAKIDRFFEGSWVRFMGEVWSIFRTEFVPTEGHLGPLWFNSWFCMGW